jgi:hypothetical protein
MGPTEWLLEGVLGRRWVVEWKRLDESPRSFSDKVITEVA